MMWGYVPCKKIILHDVEEEEQLFHLGHHSDEIGYMKETALPLLSKQLARVLLRGEGEIHSYSSASITHHDSAHLGSENPQGYTFVAQLDLTQNPAYVSILGFTLVTTLKVLTAISLMLLCTLPVVPMGASDCNDSKTSVHFTLLALNIKLADTCLQMVVDAITYVIAFWAHFSVTV
jgi:hypothetical protein